MFGVRDYGALSPHAHRKRTANAFGIYCQLGVGELKDARHLHFVSTVEKSSEFSLPSAAVVSKQLFWAILVLRAKTVVNSHLNTAVGSKSGTTAQLWKTKKMSLISGRFMSVCSCAGQYSRKLLLTFM